MGVDSLSVRVNWIEGLVFESETARGRKTLVDGQAQRGPSPMESLLTALCGCMAIDVVDILNKMRADLRGLRVEAAGRRNEEPPRYFKKIKLRFHVEGDAPRQKVERAVRLSFEKYCSVFHTLRPDLEIDWSIDAERFS